LTAWFPFHDGLSLRPSFKKTNQGPSPDAELCWWTSEWFAYEEVPYKQKGYAMGMRISTNVPSINAQNSLSKSQRSIDKSFAQLSSGNRITSAGDDAAGLAISERLKLQIRGYRQAARNAEDASALIQISEGGLSEVNNMLTRLRELAVQASSDTIGDTERGFVNTEVGQLVNEIDRIAQSTRYGEINLLDGSEGQFDFQVDLGNDDFKDRISFNSEDQIATKDALDIGGLDFSSKEGAQGALGILDDASVKVSGFRSSLGALQNRLVVTQDNLGTAEENLSAANSRIRDTDIAASTAELTRNSVLLNASIGVLSQANASPQLALRLIG
jgi:flagellin